MTARLSRAKRKRLEVKLDERRRDLRLRMEAEAERLGISPHRVAMSTTTAMVRDAVRNLEASQARASLAKDLPDLNVPLSVEAVNLAITVLVNLALTPQLALESLLAQLDDRSFEALIDDLDRGDWYRVKGGVRRPA